MTTFCSVLTDNSWGYCFRLLLRPISSMILSVCALILSFVQPLSFIPKAMLSSTVSHGMADGS